MLKSTILSGIMLVTSAGVSLGMPVAPSPADISFPLTDSPIVARSDDNPGDRERPARTAHRFIRSGNGLFYVNAVVNGAPVRFIVDTGSNIVVLTRSDATRIGLSTSTAQPTALQTVGGATRMQLGTVDRIDIAGQRLDNVDAASVENGLEVSLLGQSALSRLRSIKFSGDRLELN